MTAREMSKYLRNYLTAKGLTLSIAKSTIGLPNPQRKAHFSLWYQGFCHPLKKLLKKQRFALKKNVQEVARGSIRPRRSLTLPPRLLEHASSGCAASTTCGGKRRQPSMPPPASRKQKRIPKPCLWLCRRLKIKLKLMLTKGRIDRPRTCRASRYAPCAMRPGIFAVGGRYGAGVPSAAGCLYYPPQSSRNRRSSLHQRYPVHTRIKQVRRTRRSLPARTSSPIRFSTARPTASFSRLEW